MDFYDFGLVEKINGDNWKPQFDISEKYMYWKAILDISTCPDCRKLHGKIYAIGEKVEKDPPLHFNCRCSIMPLETVKSGTATINGIDGADWTLKYTNQLPDYYVTEDEAKNAGWRRGRWPSNFIPGKMIYKGKYDNDNGHLPQIAGRIWYEADINYTTGKRNQQRVLWSNDGLIFVTFDHYETFYEII